MLDVLLNFKIFIISLKFISEGQNCRLCVNNITSTIRKKQFRLEIEEKIRKELNDGLSKDNLISEEDKILLYKLYLKLEKEFESLDKDKL